MGSNNGTPGLIEDGTIFIEFAGSLFVRLSAPLAYPNTLGPSQSQSLANVNPKTTGGDHDFVIGADVDFW